MSVRLDLALLREAVKSGRLRLPMPRVDEGEDPTGRDTFTVEQGDELRVWIDGDWSVLQIEPGVYVGESTADRQARERREEAVRVARSEGRRNAPDPVCDGTGGIYHCGRSRSQLADGESMEWNESTASWWCSTCEAAWDD